MEAQHRGIADDLVLMEEISEEAILHTLENRFLKEKIYTFIGPVLVSLNPYKRLNIYSISNIKEYRGRYPYELPPHVYATAEDAYRSLVQEGDNQSIIISGESGAGKTENSKKIMEYISAVSGSGSERVDYVKKIFLESNPLLEAFGNAKTLRNDNSSRFGKYMEMQFNYGGQPVGGKITNYLLEKSRILKQLPGERNFHIFYQLLAGTDDEEKKLLGITSNCQDYKYLEPSQVYNIKGINDAEELDITINAMKTIGMSDEEQLQAFSVVASVLHLGNVQLAKKSDGNSVVPTSIKPQIDLIARLLGISSSQLEEVLCSRTVTGSSKRTSTYKVPLKLEEAQYTVGAFAKGLYSRLFQWLVRRINQSIEMQEKGNVIGVLDIYGFEIFDINSFEQLCINYVNEKLQQIFIELTLKSEQDEYRQEGITWEDVEYFNNQKCVELIDKKPTGIFNLLDEECVIPNGEDKNFFNKMNTRLVSNPHFIKTSDKDRLKSRSNAFTIQHYAGKVTYDAEGFVDKNKDTFFRDLQEALLSSSIQLIKDLVPEGLASDKKRPLTAGTQFVNQVAELMRTLYSCRPHYIRCIKPNSFKQAINFDKALVTDQVRYLGLLENVRVRRTGYAYRQTYEKFLQRYKMLTKETWPKYQGPAIDGVKLIIAYLQGEKNSDPSSKMYQFGKTKIFLRYPDWVYTLEELRLRKLEDIVKKIQACWRSYAIRKYYIELRAQSFELFQGKKDRKRRSVHRTFKGDYLGLSSNKRSRNIMTKFGDKKILFSAIVNKIATGLKNQQRCLMITDRAFYNLDSKKFGLKRRIPIQDIQDISVSTLCDGFVIVHVKEPHYDYVANCGEKGTEVITVLTHTFEKVTGRSVPLFFADKLSCRQRKGKKSEFIFEKGQKNFTQKSSNILSIGVDSSDLASSSDFTSLEQYRRIKGARRPSFRQSVPAPFEKMNFSTISSHSSLPLQEKAIATPSPSHSRLEQTNSPSPSQEKPTVSTSSVPLQKSTSPPPEEKMSTTPFLSSRSKPEPPKGDPPSKIKPEPPSKPRPEPPTGPRPASKTLPTRKPPPPPGKPPILAWIKYVTENGEPYWYNSTTQETTWDDPTKNRK